MVASSSATSDTRFALYAMAFGNFAVGIGSLVVAGVLQPLADDLSVSLAAVGQLITIYALAYAIGSPLLIGITGNVNRRLLLIIGLLLALGGNILAAVAPNYAVMYAARIVVALGAAIFTPVASTVAAVTSRAEERGQAIALVFAGFTAATALGVPLGTYVGLNYGWRLTFGMVALLAALSVVLVLRFVPNEVEAPQVNLRVFAQVLRNGWLLLVLLVTVFQLAAQLSLFTYITPYVESRTTLGATGITLLFLANGVAGFFGNLWGGALSDRIGARQTVLIFLLLLGGAFIAVPFIGQSVLIGAVAIAVWGAFGLGFNAPQQTRLVQLAPESASAVLGLNASFLYVGISLGSAIGGQVIAGPGLDALPVTALALTAATLVLFAISYRAERVRQQNA